MKPLERLKRTLTKGNLWLYVLKMLSNEDCHGYELRKRISERFGFDPSLISVYRVLYSLKRQNFVEETKVEERKVYRITEKGKRALEDGIMLLKSVLKVLE